MIVPRVTILGSCRVYEPFRLLEEAGEFEIRNRGVYGYVHYAKESLQQLRVMRGDLEIPLELKPYITHKVVPEGAGRELKTSLNDLSDTDLLVVEVSSLKEIEFDGFYLQINRLRDKLVGTRPSLVRWWNYLYDKGLTEQELARRERRQFFSDDLTHSERKLVMWTNVCIQDEASLMRDMLAIRGYFPGPILWVSHFDTPTLADKPIPIRRTLFRNLRRCAAELDQPVFNPRGLIERYGRHDALLDMAHYKPAFERELALHFGKAARACLPQPVVASARILAGPS